MSFGRLSLGTGFTGMGGGRVANDPSTPLPSLDFEAGQFVWDGVTYNTVADYLTAGGGTFANATTTRYSLDGANTYAANVVRVQSGLMLLEPASENIILQGKFATGWNGDGAVFTANNDTAPDGTTTAARVREDATTGAGHGVFADLAGALTANRHVVSVFTKRAVGTRDFYTITFDSEFSSSSSAIISLADGSVLTASSGVNGWSAGVASSLPAAQSYYRCANSFVSTVEAGFYPFMSLSNGTTPGYDGDNTSALSMWGAQLEVAQASGYFLNNPSSFIPTTTGTATRAADVLTLTIPVGVTAATVTFDNDATQNFTSLSGTWEVPTGTGLTRPFVKSVIFS